MDVFTYQPNNTALIHSQAVNGDLLEVRDAEHYRFFTFGGDIIQSLMNKQKAHQVILPVCRSMLLFLLWKKPPLTVLNLGIGGATFERYFNEIPETKVTSVDNCPHVISMAKRYFNLSEQADVHCQPAEAFLHSNSVLFDVVLCDIFSEQQNVDCVYTLWFYEKLAESLAENGVVSINLDPIDAQHTLKVLQLSSQCFPHIAIIEFKDYKNIVLILSKARIPDKESLLVQNELSELDIEFGEFISSMHYLPVT